MLGRVELRGRRALLRRRTLPLRRPRRAAERRHGGGHHGRGEARRQDRRIQISARRALLRSRLASLFLALGEHPRRRRRARRRLRRRRRRGPDRRLRLVDRGERRLRRQLGRRHFNQGRRRRRHGGALSPQLRSNCTFGRTCDCEREESCNCRGLDRDIQTMRWQGNLSLRNTNKKTSAAELLRAPRASPAARALPRLRP